jgi:coiled-coil domain-containing protein 40
MPENDVPLNPDDPLLERAQQALKKQLSETKQRVIEELREKTKLLSDAKQRKEDLGVNLFNFQQQLATLQMELEKSHETHTTMAAIKQEVAQKVSEMKQAYDKEMQAVRGDRLQADKFQEELDRSGAQSTCRLHQNDQARRCVC